MKIFFLFLTCVFVVLSIPTADVLRYNYTANSMPRDDGWTIVNYPAYESGHVYLDPTGILHLNDPNTYGGSACHYYKTISTIPSGTNVALEFRVKVVYGTTWGFYLSIEDGIRGFGVSMNTDSLVLDNGLGTTIFITTTGNYFDYRMELNGSEARLYQNGFLLYNGTTSIGPLFSGQTSIQMGLGGSPSIAEAYLDELRVYTVTPVPEISSWLALVLGLFLILRLQLRVD